MDRANYRATCIAASAAPRKNVVPATNWGVAALVEFALTVEVFALEVTLAVCEVVVAAWVELAAPEVVVPPIGAVD